MRVAVASRGSTAHSTPVLFSGLRHGCAAWLVSQAYPALRICRQGETGRDPSTPAACRVKTLKNRADFAVERRPQDIRPSNGMIAGCPFAALQCGARSNLPQAAAQRCLDQAR